MIPILVRGNQPSSVTATSFEAIDARWQTQLKLAIRDPLQLLKHLNLVDSPLALSVEQRPAFALRVPLPYVARMRREDPNDPLLLQVLSLRQEEDVIAGYGRDPLLESDASRAAGLIQKYQHRALIIAAPSCAIHCRYCFRRHFPYQEHSSAGDNPWLAVLREDETVHEAILSGGDPLMRPDGSLRSLVTALDEIPHLRRLRIHSRLPVVIPDRITDALVDTLANTRLQTSLVLHINHAQEIDAELLSALAPLRSRVTLFNQSVLLRGVNDTVSALADLSERLFAAGVIPYYLHQLDPVAGAAHFAVGDGEAIDLVSALRSRLPGYLVPRLVREVPGEAAKRPLF